MLDIAVQERNGHVNIVLSRDLDVSTVEIATERCRHSLQGQPRSLVLHLEALRFIDSAGLRFLLALVTRAEAAGCACAMVTGANARFHRLARILHLEANLPLYLTQHSALYELSRRVGAAGD